MRTLSATEASRAFAALLDGVENGETVVITRGGRRIAAIGPVSQGNGAELLDFLSAQSIDAEFAHDVSAARRAVTLGESPWGDD